MKYHNYVSSAVDAFMRQCRQPVALFCRGYTADGKVIDVVLRERQENTRYQLRQHNGDVDWVLVRFTVMEAPIKGARGCRMQAREFMEQIGCGSLVEMKRLADNLACTEMSA